MLKEALEYLKRGWSVIPVNSSKRPLIKFMEYTKRLPTVDEVTKWFTDFPEANLAIVTGKVSGITVVDLDHGESPADYPPTYSVITPRNGVHLYYKYAGEMANHIRIKDNTDIRNDNAYVLAPPSHINGVHYHITIDGELTDFPHKMFIEAIQKQSNVDWEEVVQNKNGPGERNNALTKVAGKLLYHLPEDEWETIGWELFKSFDLTHNEPSIQEEWGLDDLRTKWDGIATKESKKEKLLIAPIASGFQADSLKEFMTREFKTSSWIIKDFIPNGLTILAGETSIGKTWLYLDLAVKVANGTKFLTNFQCQQSGVLIVDREMKSQQLQLRLNMLTDNLDIPLHISSDSNFTITLPKLQEMRAFCVEHGIKLVIMDSLRRVLKGDENSSEHVNNMYNLLKAELLDHDIGVMITHHLSKGEYKLPRGSGDIINSSDLTLIMEKKDGDLQLNPIKVRYSVSPRPIRINIETDNITKYAMHGPKFYFPLPDVKQNSVESIERRI